MKTIRRKLLMIDRYPAVYRYLRRRFSGEGYDITGLQAPEQASAMVAELSPDIVVLATDLLTGKGAALIQHIRSVTSVPILGLLPGSHAEDAVRALDAGVDDCIAQPFSLEEFAVRLRNLLRKELVRRGFKPGITSGVLQIDLVARRIWHNSREIILSDIEFRLLQLLVTADGGVVASKDLRRGLFGAYSGDAVGALRSVVWSLRNKIESDPHRPVHIQTVWSVGYRFSLGVANVAQPCPARGDTHLRDGEWTDRTVIAQQMGNGAEWQARLRDTRSDRVSFYVHGG
ncbi:MAG: response regulator transcription factor [Acetobacteraceae bacterium]|jgi:two-component system KDP operon response regulator KdpE